MGSVVGQVPATTPANDLDGRCADSNDAATECNRLLVGCVNDVIDRSGEKAQELAKDAGYSEFSFSRIRSCQTGALDFVDRLPIELQREIARRFAEAHGFTVTEPTPADVALALLAGIEHLAQIARLARRTAFARTRQLRAGVRR